MAAVQFCLGSADTEENNVVHPTSTKHHTILGYYWANVEHGGPKTNQHCVNILCLWTVPKLRNRSALSNNRTCTQVKTVVHAIDLEIIPCPFVYSYTELSIHLSFHFHFACSIRLSLHLNVDDIGANKTIPI